MRFFSSRFFWGSILLLLLSGGLRAIVFYNTSPLADTSGHAYPVEYYYRQKQSFTMGFFEFMLRHVLQPAKKGLRDFESGDIFTRADVIALAPKLDTSAVRISVTQVQGRQVFTLQSRSGGQPGGKVVLYLHGGAYVGSFGDPHWQFMQQVVEKTGFSVVAPDYPLAPQHTYRAVFTLVEAVYKDLAAKVGAQNVLLMGDSAGAGLALALAEQLKQEHAALPAQLMLLSPWLDATLQNPGVPPVAPLDPMLSVVQLRLAAKAYAGTTPLTDYHISPLNGELAGLPRTSVFIGSHDIFLADARKFKQLMAAQGNPVNYFEYNAAFHVWMLAGSPEGKLAQQQIINLLKD